MTKCFPNRLTYKQKKRSRTADAMTEALTDKERDIPPQKTGTHAKQIPAFCSYYKYVYF